MRRQKNEGEVVGSEPITYCTESLCDEGYICVQNGTGVYEKLWSLMRRQKNEGEVESGEDGMLRVGSEPSLAMLGGRETLYFDTRRFGADRFHLSEKLFTRYSAIALQIGCPYIDSINSM